MRKETYIISSIEKECIKFLNGFEYQINSIDIETELIKLISKTLINYDFSVPDDIKLFTLNEFIKDFNEDEFERELNQKIHYIAQISVKIL